MELKMDFKITAEVDNSIQARAWQKYFAHLQQLLTDAIEQQLHDNPPPQSERYAVKVTKTDYLV